MKKLLTFLATFAFVLVLAPTAISNAGQPVVTYEVTITNLTSGQAFTPPLLATHTDAIDIFNVGEAASGPVAAIAENGDLSGLIAVASGSSAVYDAVVGDAPLVPASNPGGTPFASSATYIIQASNGAKYLSFISMLICTNDGFTGLDSMRLPKVIGATTMVYGAGYDAGSEINTEDFADIVPPCQGLIGISSDDEGTGMSNPALAEGGVITHHPNIQGGNDLVPAVHGWTDPVVSISITRVD